MIEIFRGTDKKKKTFKRNYIELQKLAEQKLARTRGSGPAVTTLNVMTSQ